MSKGKKDEKEMSNILFLVLWITMAESLILLGIGVNFLLALGISLISFLVWLVVVIWALLKLEVIS